MENNFQQAFGNDSCVRCGRCCANVLMLSDHEIQVIRKYIKRHNIQVQNHNVIGMKEDANICPFKKQSISYDGEKHINEGTFCAIYPVRPSICRSYSCNPKFRQTMNYDNVKAINMLFTFGGNNQFSIKAPDLTLINKRIKELQEKIKRGENK